VVGGAITVEPPPSISIFLQLVAINATNAAANKTVFFILFFFKNFYKVL
jgi:hypothetical protein